MEIKYNPHDSKSVELDLNAIHHLSEIRYWAFIIGTVGLAALAIILITSLTDWAPWVSYFQRVPYTGRCFLISLVGFAEQVIFYLPTVTSAGVDTRIAVFPR